VPLPADDDARFALVHDCVAAVERRGAGARLHFSSDHHEDVPRMPATMAPSRLIGRRIGGRGKVTDIYRYVQYPARHFGRVEKGREVYFPSLVGGGESVCFEP
jgi:hypothetical protein